MIGTHRIALTLCLLLPSLAAAQTAPRPDADPRIEKIVASISEERLKELLTKLVSFGTRNTLSDQTSTTRGIGAARNWILEEMRRSSEKLRVSFDTHQIAPQGRITRLVDLRNVMAVLPGRSPRRLEHQPPPAIAAPTSTAKPTAPTTMAAARC